MCFLKCSILSLVFPGGSMVKNLPGNAGDTGSIHGPVRSLKKEMATPVFLPGEPRTGWRATVCEIAESDGLATEQWQQHTFFRKIDNN